MIFHQNPTVGISLLDDGNMGPSEDIRNPNRLNFFARLGIEPSRVRGVKQIHSRRVVTAVRKPVPADGLVSCRRDLVLSVTVADCVPVFLWDRYERGFGIVHSGWKGTGIVLDAVSLLEEKYGIPASDLHAYIGPSIGPCCYEVDSERARRFRDEWGEAAVVEGEGTSRLDLPGTNWRLLVDAGIGEIDTAGKCTCCSPELGSYRRQGSTGFTRMIAFIGYLV